MKIKDTGIGLNPYADFYRENRTRTAADHAKGTSGVSFSTAFRRSAKTPAAGRTDKIEISGQTEPDASLPEQIGGSVRRAISADADPARLESLKNRVAAGTYSADPADLAHILLTDR